MFHFDNNALEVSQPAGRCEYAAIHHIQGAAVNSKARVHNQQQKLHLLTNLKRGVKLQLAVSCRISNQQAKVAVKRHAHTHTQSKK